MIFVTIGTHSQGFDRLVHAVDSLAARSKEEFIIQIGDASSKPKYAKWFTHRSEKEMGELYRRARVVISHAGAGSIISALRYKKPLIVVPRLKKFGEHIDDHQKELANAVSEAGLATALLDITNLEESIKHCKRPVGAGERKQKLVAALRDILEEMK